MKRLFVLLAALAFAACSSGSPIIPASLDGPVAVVPFIGRNPAESGFGLVPLLAVASFRSDELALIDPNTDLPVAAPNLAWGLTVPTLARPSFLASGSLHDAVQGADLLVVAGSQPRLQIVGTWLDGTGKYGIGKYGIVETMSLAAEVGGGAQILSMVVTPVPAGPPVGTPPVAPVTPGRARIVVGVSDPLDLTSGELVIIEMVRLSDGSIRPAGPPVVMDLGFAPLSIAVSPDNVRLFIASTDPIVETSGRVAFGLAEVDTGGGLDSPWTVRAFEALGASTTTVAAAFVGERTEKAFFVFKQPELRVYATLDRSRCGPQHPIGCGVATFDPATGALATDPAPPGPPGSKVPTQSYRTPFVVPSLPMAMAIAFPAALPGTGSPGSPFGSQVCYSPADKAVPLPLCPSVTEIAGSPPFNLTGYPQRFMVQAPATGQLWTSVVGLVTSIDGLAYVMDLGRYGPVNSLSMLGEAGSRTSAVNSSAVGPIGPFGNSGFFGFPAGTAAIGFWQDHPTSGGTTPRVVSDSTDLAAATIVWPGFTHDDHWLVSYQGVLPGFAQRRSVLGLDADTTLYVAIQEAAVPSENGTLPASSYWVTGAYVAEDQLGVHPIGWSERDPGDIALFLLDNDPCPSKRPNWIPAGQTTPVFDPTQPPMAHEFRIASFLPEIVSLYPGGALNLLPPRVPEDDPELVREYLCLVDELRKREKEDPEKKPRVFTMFRNNPPTNDYARGTWVRAGKFLLIGAGTGYAGRPLLDVRYDLAWADETQLSGEALLLARKARRFYYASAYATRLWPGFPEMTDPMQPGPALGFRLGRFCTDALKGCNATTSPPARDAGVDFYTQSGFLAMSRHPSNTSGGNSVTSFDKSIFPGQEYRGRVFYSTFIGDLLFMIPPGLDVGQTLSIR